MIIVLGTRNHSKIDTIIFLIEVLKRRPFLLAAAVPYFLIFNKSGTLVKGLPADPRTLQRRLGEIDVPAPGECFPHIPSNNTI